MRNLIFIAVIFISCQTAPVIVEQQGTNEFEQQIALELMVLAPRLAIAECRTTGCIRDYYIPEYQMTLKWAYVDFKKGLIAFESNKDMLITADWKKITEPTIKQFIRDLMEVITKQRQITARR